MGFCSILATPRYVAPSILQTIARRKKHDVDVALVRPLTLCWSTSDDMASVAAITDRLFHDYSNMATNYFTSIRVPAALIAGSSLSALFSMIQAAKYLQEKETRPGFIVGLAIILYHAFALIALLLSLNVVVTATASANSILLGCKDPIAPSAFDLLTREYRFEFLMTRWSFFMGMFSFLASITLRALIEFQLLRRDRLRPAALVVFSSGSLFFHLLAFVNSRLRCYNNLGSMTIGIFVLWIKNCRRRPCEVISIGCFVCSIIAAVSVLLRQYRLSSSQGDHTMSRKGEERGKGEHQDGPK